MQASDGGAPSRLQALLPNLCKLWAQPLSHLLWRLSQRSPLNPSRGGRTGIRNEQGYPSAAVEASEWSEAARSRCHVTTPGAGRAPIANGSGGKGSPCPPACAGGRAGSSESFSFPSEQPVLSVPLLACPGLRGCEERSGRRPGEDQRLPQGQPPHLLLLASVVTFRKVGVIRFLLRRQQLGNWTEGPRRLLNATSRVCGCICTVPRLFSSVRCTL